jgi:hypothetical protein
LLGRRGSSRNLIRLEVQRAIAAVEEAQRQDGSCTDQQLVWAPPFWVASLPKYPIQLAKAAEAEVLTTASSDEKLARLREFGAMHVINHKTRLPLSDARKSEVWSLLVISLVGQGIFNSVATWIEDIVRPHGITPDEAGSLGGLLLAGGLVGAIVFPLLSDRLRRRKPFSCWAPCCAVPCLAGAAWATSHAGYAVAFVALGVFLVGLAPILFQYGAELTLPAPEGTSNGLLNLAGQALVVFVYAMQPLRSADGSFRVPLLVLAGLLAASPALLTRTAIAPSRSSTSAIAGATRSSRETSHCT